MSSTVIRTESLGKMYHIGGARAPYKTLREALVDAAKAPIRRVRNFGRSSSRKEDRFWALRDVDLTVENGEVLGIIGRNGAGKSTLLKILTRVTEPTEGRARLHGRVGSLLEVGTGFHPELTGRENIYLSGSILGMTRREIDRRFDEIVEFAEVERFLDTPIKRYSSGMGVRLGFAVAAHLDPEILLIDEVLAVGDISFQRKSLNKMKSVGSSGRTVLFVSHNIPAVTNLCDRIVLLDEGRVVRDGAPRDVVEEYRRLAVKRTSASHESPGVWSLRDGRDESDVRIGRIEMRDPESGRPKGHLATGDGVLFRLHYRSSVDAKNASFGFEIYTTNGVRLINYTTYHDLVETPLRAGQEGTLDCVFPTLPLSVGEYLLGVRVSIPHGGYLFRASEYGHLEVGDSTRYRMRTPYTATGSCPLYVEHRWEGST